MTDRTSIASTGYAVRRPLVRWLAEEARLAGEGPRRPRLLDVGCGDKPYASLFVPYVSEHVADPARVVAELRRVVAPGGRVLASTHGVQVYHPNPDDLWRWTHAGLERLFRENGEWSAVTVTPGSGTAACLGMLIAHYADLLAKRARVRPLGFPFVVAANLGGRGLDALVPGLRGPQPGTIFANYHVVAEPS